MCEPVLYSELGQLQFTATTGFLEHGGVAALELLTANMKAR
jgi:hypothetical protein